MCDEVKRLKRDGARRQVHPITDTTGIRYRVYDTAFGLAQQRQLLHRAQTQEWVGVCDVTFPKIGRGLVSLQKIKKDDVIVDYHGIVVTDITMEKYAKKDGVRRDYCIEIDQKPKRIIDASAETCTEHPGHRCLGRLANHGKKGTANMCIADIVLDQIATKPRVVVLMARTDIEPLQQLRFDYSDTIVRALFTD